MAAAVAGTIYAENYLNKQPCRTSALTGHQWMLELQHGNATRIYENFRMGRDVFYQLCNLLETNYELQSGKKVGVQQQVAIFVFIVGQHANNRNAQERFQLSGETISKYFHSVLKACVKMSVDWVKPWQRNGVHPYIKNSRKYYPHFKNCIGAIDGTHIKAHVEAEYLPRFIGRKGYATQNILAVCDFDICFTFACLVGREVHMTCEFFGIQLGIQTIIFHIQKEMSIIWLILAIQTQRVILRRTKGRDII
ncbi:unnamed protein product [Camellia sinensis]